MTSQRLLAHVLGVLSLLSAGAGIAAERFSISIPGPTLSYVPLYYAQEKGFFAQEGLDLQVLVVRGVIGVSSLMSGEIDVTCHAGSGFSAALRGVPIKIISVTRDRPIHELIVAPNINSPAELKGKAIAVGSLDGTAAVMTRRILQAKGLDGQKDVNLLSMDTPARLQSLFSGRVAGAMMTPPSVYMAQDQGYKVFGRGRDYMRFLQTGVVTSDTNIKQKREKLMRFLRVWNRGLKVYQDSPEIMIPYIQKKLGVKDAQMARRMYDDDAPFILSGGRLGADAAREIVDIGREALHIKEPIPTERIFDFSLASEALR
ncbi:MAG: ABC transporter substrate-binding protein [Deltaproteobacteria bacterium]|nr:ABC transporter substrate-binding protein [Deltaproteobacteria bacterium]MBI2227769.1 ABC transporter substrate-binding protein [Deltaproteobacteria bacterium]MBI2366998.1 ABC transporter substrate-binding protein [Deltaproteobacteria bacterium]MBI3064678.1 ABC transporter substrate-binding protein [Deltaproteobacteria bacterium]